MSKKSQDHPVLDTEAFARGRGIFAPGPTGQPKDAVRALATEVINRLSNRHALPVVQAASDRVPLLDTRMDARIDALCRALLALDDQAATDLVMEAHAEGADVDALYVGYLAEAARRLGRWWEEDRVSSVEVVIASGRIYAIMRGLRRLFGPGEQSDTNRPRAIFAAVPGETHTLGVSMAADRLSRHGWDIDLRAGLTHDELVAELAQTRYPIIGLSAASQRMVFPLARLIVALRVSNPAAWIMVCGRLAEIEPDLARQIDADAVATDLASAEAAMEAHLTGLSASGRNR